MEVVSSEDMQKRYAKVVEWYGGKEAFLNIQPLSKEVAESYKKREEMILYKLVKKQGCDVNSFEVKEIVGEYAFVMKQFCQLKQEKGLMMGLAQYYHNQKIIPIKVYWLFICQKVVKLCNKRQQYQRYLQRLLQQV